MCHALHDPAFFRFLTQIDAQLAAEARQRRCPECAGPLHVADFPRKPRGCPASVREEYSSRTEAGQPRGLRGKSATCRGPSHSGQRL